jgi:broad specificity phosphatase PhoE
MSTLFFVRHVEHVLQHEVLLGRSDGAPVSVNGERQLTDLLARFRNQQIDAVYSSPRQRARATAQAIRPAQALPVQICDDLDELDYGVWSGRRFDELARDPHWQRWNEARSSTCPPGGESMALLQERMLRYVRDTASAHSGEVLICVTHAEPIRALILHICGLPLDEFARVDVPPGGVTQIRTMPQSALLECVQEARSA